MVKKELQKLYNAVNAKLDIGDYGSFKSKMSNTGDRKKFYYAVGKNGFDLGDYNEYENRMTGVKENKTLSTQPARVKEINSKQYTQVANGDWYEAVAIVESTLKHFII